MTRPPLSQYPSRLHWAADLFARMHAHRLEQERNTSQPAPEQQEPTRERQPDAKRAS
ncbi:hypothetical protein HLB42_09785 [Deinococcus sp. D7000]|uniref:hypothetical protein n=1 Tax=Deinococcus radiopugnans TaxID=57497 RepID=UPI000A3F608F|nr:hypothetical protein [Deinococcus radiopugnans]QLG11033.1 hypothetical protein HLB42_09785 [Deinococcus sp. D7000]